MGHWRQRNSSWHSSIVNWSVVALIGKLYTVAVCTIHTSLGPRWTAGPPTGRLVRASLRTTHTTRTVLSCTPVVRADYAVQYAYSYHTTRPPMGRHCSTRATRAECCALFVCGSVLRYAYNCITVRIYCTTVLLFYCTTVLPHLLRVLHSRWTLGQCQQFLTGADRNSARPTVTNSLRDSLVKV